MTSSNAEAIAQAEAALPLDRLVVQLFGHEITKRTPCPFCVKRGKFGLFTKNGRRKYKCFNSACKASDPGDAVSLIALVHNLSNRDAFKEYLRLSGVSQH